MVTRGQSEEDDKLELRSVEISTLLAVMGRDPEDNVPGEIGCCRGPGLRMEHGVRAKHRHGH
jgi:hypothetical protein